MLLGKLVSCGFIYFLSIEAAYAMFDPKASPFTRALQDISRQVVTMVAATMYFKQVVSRNEGMGYSIALIGQLLQSLDETTPTYKQLSMKKVSPRKSHPKMRKRP